MRVLHVWIALLAAVAVFLAALAVWAVVERYDAKKGWKSSAIQQMGAVSRTSQLPFEEAALLAATSYSMDSTHPSAWQALSHHSVDLNYLDRYIAVNDDGKLFRHYAIDDKVLITTISHEQPGKGDLILLEGKEVTARSTHDSAPYAICHLPASDDSPNYVYLDFSGNLFLLEKDQLLKGEITGTPVFTDIDQLFCLDKSNVILQTGSLIGTWDGHKSSEPVTEKLPPQTELLGTVGKNRLLLSPQSESFLLVTDTRLNTLFSVSWDERIESFNTPNALRKFALTSNAETAWVAVNQGRLIQIELESGESHSTGCDLSGDIPFSISHIEHEHFPMLALGGTRGSLGYYDLNGTNGCRLIHRTQVSNTSIQHLLPVNNSNQVRLVDGNGKISFWHVPGSFSSRNYRIPEHAFPVNITGTPDKKLNIQFTSPRTLSATSRMEANMPTVVDNYSNTTNYPVCLLFRSEEWCIAEGKIKSENNSILLGHDQAGRYIFSLQQTGTKLAVLNQDTGDIAVIDLEQKKNIYKVQISQSSRTLAIADGSPELAVSVTDQHVQVVDYQTGDTELLKSVAPFGVTALAYDHEDNLWSASTSKSSLKRLTQSTKPTTLETGIEGTLLDFDFSADGQWLIAGSMSGNTILMNLSTGLIERNPVSNSGNQAYFARFPWRENLAVFGSSNGQVSILNADFKSLAHSSCAKLSERLSESRLERLGLDDLKLWSEQTANCQRQEPAR